VRIAVNGVRLFFDVDGPGLVPNGAVMVSRPTILLLHGGPGQDHSYFKPWAAHLTEFGQVVYLDLRGNGRSDRGPADRWTLEQWADDIVSFCQALDIETPVVLGHSFGGQVAQVLATRHPGVPSRLILMNCAARLRFDVVLDAFERLGGTAARRIAERCFLHNTPESTAEFARRVMPLYDRTPRDLTINRRMIVNRELLASFLQYPGPLHSFDLLESLGALTIPILVLTGEDDPVATPVHLQEMVSASRHGSIRGICLPRCGHLAFHDAPEATLAAIRAFLDTGGTPS